MRRAAAVLLLLLPAVAVAGDAWTVATETRPETLVVGEKFEVWLAVLAEVPSEPEVEVQEPLWGPGLVATSASYQSADQQDGRYRYSKCWQFVADGAGSLSIPPIRVVLHRRDNGTAETKATEALSKSVAPAEEADRHRPGAAAGAARPEPPPPATPAQRGVIAALVGLVGLTVMLAGLLRKPRPALPEPTAEARAGEALEQLRAPAAEGELEAFYAALAGVLRGFVVARCGLEAEALTTREAAAALRSNGCPAALGGAVVRALETADRVRFARDASSPAEAAALLGALRGSLVGGGGR